MGNIVLRTTANLDRENLSQANLTGIDLRGASLQYANLRGADLRGTIGLTQTQIEMACIDKKTQWPSDLTKIDKPKDPEQCNRLWDVRIKVSGRNESLQHS